MMFNLNNNSSLYRSFIYFHKKWIILVSNFNVEQWLQHMNSNNFYPFESSRTTHSGWVRVLEKTCEA